MYARGHRHGPEIVVVRRDDVVSVTSEEDDTRIHDVGCPGASEQHPGPSTQTGIDGHDLDPGQQPGQRRLAPTPTSPDLSDDAAMGSRRATGEPLGLEKRHDLAIGPLNCDERTRAKNECHGAPPPRTTTLWLRAARVASRISWSVISPCSASNAAKNSSSALIRRSWSA